MTDAIPQIILGLGDGSEYVVMVGEDEAEATDLASLLTLAPALKQPEAALEMAQAVNYLSQGPAFEVIDDPALFEANYRKTLDAEDASTPWTEGVVRLSDYGVPDFTEITKPNLTGTKLVYFAVDTMLGLPYRVEVNIATPHVKVTDDSYKALDLEPLDFDEPQQMPTPVDPQTDPLSKMMATKPSSKP